MMNIGISMALRYNSKLDSWAPENVIHYRSLLSYEETNPPSVVIRFLAL